MAHLDPERERVVIRIVYDGPALAGKTTSVRALAEIFDRPVFSSEDRDGRTLHFDWMEYEGGRFGGLSVCCQVITVPGQPALATRRRLLLESADAVIFVTDSRSSALDEGLAAFESLRALLRTSPKPRAGLILQANKRDAADAVALEDLREALALAETVAVTESIALDGTGIRQTFVFAVRLALDRVSELMEGGQLPSGAPEVTSGPALLEALRRLEAASSSPALVEPVEAPALRPREPRAATAVPAAEARNGNVPEPPAPDLPCGRVWPPVEGRMVLHEATSWKARLEPLSNGDWIGAAGPWRLQAPAAGRYAEVEEARLALIEWARWHASLGRYLSPRRCVTLAEEAGGKGRLWQVVRHETTLRSQLELAFRQADPEIIARDLLESAGAFEDCRSALAGSGLRLDLDNLATLESGPTFVALVPTPSQLARLRAGEEPPAQLAAALAPALRRARGTLAPILPAITDRLGSLARTRGQEELAEDLLAWLAELA